MKIVTVRKDHDCAGCGEAIPKGAKAEYHSTRFPVYDEHDKQTGIEYDRWYFHNYRCDLTKEEREQCGAGNHKWEPDYELDGYVGCHPVYIPTSKDYCTVCGERRQSEET